MSKKNKTFIDPRFAIGNQIRQDLNQIISDESQYLYEPLRSGEFRTNTDGYDDYLKTSPVQKSLYPNTDENGQILPVESVDDESIFGDFSYRNEHSSLIDAWRMTFEKGYQSRYLAKTNLLQDINDQLDDVKLAQDYKNKLEELYDIEAEMYRAQDNGADDVTVLKYRNRLEAGYKELDLLEQQLKTKWKQSDALLDIFTDTDAYDDPRITGADTYFATHLYNIGPIGNPNYNGNVINDIFQCTKRLFGTFGNVVGGTVAAAKETLTGGKDYGYLKRAIKNSPDDVHVFDHLFSSYKSHQGEGKGHVKLLQSKIDKIKLQLDRDKAEKEVDLESTLNTYKNGNWLFNPKKIDPIYRKLLEEEDRGILKTIVDPSRWLYAAPEIGSSFSDLADFVGLLMLNGGASLAASKLANTAIMSNPYARAMYEMAVVGGGLYFSNQMRRMETDAEATDAYSNRVIKESLKAGIDLANILRLTNDHLNSIGISTDDLNVLELLQLALAYNVPTDDPLFNQIKKDARKGIAKVINENNALSFIDYLQTIPFMNYSRGLVGKMGSGMFNRTSFAEKMADRWIASAKQQGLRGKSINTGGNAISKAWNRLADGFLDDYIDKVASKISKNIATRSAIARTSKYIKNKAKSFGLVGATEGIEEGQQQLLQNRFARGDYDEYDQYASSFDIPSVFEDVGLGMDALLAYWGLNFGDPDNDDSELKKAMNIGAVTGMMFGLGHALTNIMPTDQDNVRNLIAQLKNDAVLRRIVANQLDLRQDDEHVSIFFDAFSKAGVNADRLSKSIQQLKNFKGDFVTDKDIDRDMDLMRTAWNSYKNPAVKDILEDLGIKKDSELHKMFVQLAVRKEMKQKELLEKTTKSLGLINDKIEEKLHKAGGNAEEAGSSLYQIVQKIKEKYNGHISNTAKKYASDEQSFRNKAIRDAAEKNLKERGIEYSLSDIDEEARRISKSNDEMQRLLRLNTSDFNMVSENEFVENMLVRMFDSSLLDNIDALLKNLKDKSERNKFLKTLFGVDVNLDNLNAIIKVIKEERKYVEDKIKNDTGLEQINKAIDEYNKNIRVLNKKRALEGKEPIKEIEHKTEKDLLKEYGEFEDQDEINKLQIGYLMNYAVELVHAPLAEAFNFGEVRPDLILKSIKPAYWSELSQEQRDEYTELVRKRYEQEGRSERFKGEKTARTLYNNDVQKAISKVNKLVKDRENILKRMSETQEGEMSFADVDDLRLVNRQAAKLYISEQIKEEQQKRSRAEEEGPITPDDIESAEAGDEKAKRKVAGAAKLIDDVSVEGPTVEEVEEHKEVKSGTSDTLLDEIGDHIAGEDYERTKKKSKKLREKEREEKRKRLADEMKSLTGLELTKYMIEHPDLVFDAGEDPLSFLRDHDVLQNIKGYKDGLVIFRVKSGDDIIYYAVYRHDVTDDIKNEYGVTEEDESDFKFTGLVKLTPVMVQNESIVTVDSNVGFNMPDGYVVSSEDDESTTVNNINEILYAPDDKHLVQVGVKSNGNITWIHKPGVDFGADDKRGVDGSDDSRSGIDTGTDGEDSVIESGEDPMDSSGEIAVDDTDNVIEIDGNAPVIDVEPDPSSIHVEPDGAVYIDGQRSTISLEYDGGDVIPVDEQQLLDDIDRSFTDYSDYVSDLNKKRNRRNVEDKEDVGEYIESTFFYQPESNEPMVLSHPSGGYITEKKDGKVYLNGKEVMPGSELAKKLSEKGWFYNIPDENKYYVVSQHKGNTDKKNPDGFTITLAIEDGDKVYLASLRTPEKYSFENKEGKTEVVDGVERIKASLRMIRVDREKFEEILEERIADAYDTVHPGSKVGIGTKKRWFNELPKDNNIKRSVIDQARVRARKRIKKIPLSEELIDQQIERLKAARNKIIDAYCDKNPDGSYSIPKELRTNVHPENSEISNGTIENGETPHSATNVSDVSDIQKLIEQGKIRMGYGLGGMQYVRSNSRYAIRNIFKGTAKYTGFGLSGKIYYIVEGPGGTDAAILMSEELFDTQRDLNGNVIFLHKSTDNLKLGITLNSKGYGEVTSTTSAAEVLLYLMCDKLSHNEFPAETENLQSNLVKLFINCSNKTIMEDRKDTQNAFPNFAAKQLSFEKGVLTIGEQDKDGNWHPVPYPVDEIFGDSAEQIATRRKLIYQIAENMHWNTDHEDMAQKINVSILNALRKWFTSNPNATSFKLCGIDQFEFKKEDLFILDKDGKIVKERPITLAAWMLKNNKLMLDTSEQMFYAPFVFADGVMDSQKDKHTVVKKGPKKIKSAVDKTAEEQALREKIDTKEKLDRVLSKIGEETIARTAEKKKEILDSYAESLKENGGMKDILVVDLGNDKFSNIDEVKSKIHKSVEEYIEKQNSSRDEDKKIKLSTEDWECIDGMTKLDLKPINNGKKFPVFYVTNNGTGSTLVLSTVNDIKAESNITGVASRLRGRGKLNEQRTRDWVKRTLGIDDSQMIVVDGIIKSCSDGDVYGLTQICCDVLDTLFAAFTFSSIGGRGIAYHEAWHYVNLLLHNSAQRMQIYKAYVEKHPELRSAKFKDIEEKLAEDFRKYGEMMNENNISNVIKRVFSRFLDFVFKYRKRDLIRGIFDSILKGNYVGIKMDQASVEEFKRTYLDGVYKAEFSYPGVRQEDLDNLEGGVNDYHTFQQVGISLANKLLEYYDVLTIEDLSEINHESFKQFMDNLEKKNKTERNARKKKIVETILKNSAAFKTVANRVLKLYGVTPKYTKRGKLLKDVTKIAGDQEEEREPIGGLINKEDAPTNIWDIEAIEVSKKANVAFRAKLFLSQIPDSKWVTEEVVVDGKKKYTKKTVVKTDDILGATIYVPYGKAWNKVMNALWQAESFGKMVNGKYSRKSIMGIVERRKAAEPFFEQLWNRLQEAKGDVLLESLIFCTVASSKNQIASMQISDKPKSNMQKLIEEELSTEDPEIADYFASKDAGSIADRMRVWDMFDDNNLRAKKNLPRVWSKNAIAAGMAKYHKDKITVDKSYANYLHSLVEHSEDGDALMDIIVSTDKKLNRLRNMLKREQYLDPINDLLCDTLLLTLNVMGIPFDQETLNYYISMHLENPQDLSNPVFKYNAIKSIIDDSSKAGGIRFFVEQIEKAAKSKRDYFLSGDRKKTKRAIDKLFTGYSDEYEITKMAQAFNTMNPSSADFSVVGPDGDLIYPMSQNNFMSDQIRWLNNSDGEKASEMMNDPYSRNSIILNISRNMDYDRLTIDDMFKLDTFVGIRDSRLKKGNDYFGITPMEDYIAKMFMLFNDRLVLPTMADKKTWYAIKFGDAYTRDAHVTPHEVLRWNDRTYSLYVVNIFAGYLRDEIDALKQYYSKENILYLIDHPGELRENYHGDVIDGRMDFSGNGGKFRYFYDLFIQDGMNLNEYLEFEYNRQKAMESGEINLENGIAWLYEDENELDGFELVRRHLDEIELRYFGKDSLDTLNADITAYLNNIVDQELEELSKPGSLNVVTKLDDGRYVSRAIPYQILNYYSEKYTERGYTEIEYSPYGNDENIEADLALSVITNNVLGSMMSVIEMEKVFSGDPAFYKWKYKDNTREVEAKADFGDDVLRTFKTNLKILSEKHTDKIKRLGAVLSPGENLNTELSEEILKKFPELRGTKYTNLNIADAVAVSQFVEELTGMFERSATVDAIRNSEKYSEQYTEEQLEEMYSDEKKAKEALDAIKKDDNDLYKSIKKSAQASVNPYTKINVSDALVIIRPHLYRKIRIELGEWTFIEDADGYSDEKAYHILEEDSEWMRDPEKAAMVAKLQLKPLKMTYFMNNPKAMAFAKDNLPFISNMPVYNKMAIFPLFKYAASSVTGQQLYERMNMEGNELDMVTFESAVKVGGHKNKYRPFEKGTSDISKLSDLLNRRSSVFLSKEDSDYGDPKVRESIDGEEFLQVQVQDLNGLHLQLNTDAHHDTERAIGTQMFKIAFSNIVEKAMYGKRSGRLVRADVMKCINALTKIGVLELRNEFYRYQLSEDGKIQYKLKQGAVDAFIKRIVENNGLGASAEEIINNGGVVASLMSRKVFENSTFATVAHEVIDTNTKGGSAVLQSVFGFVGYGKKDVVNDENVGDILKQRGVNDFPLLNGGKELSWLRSDGSMEVMLSMNFFKAVIPESEQTTYEHMREWLFKHGVIGTKSKPYGVGYRIPTQGMSSMFSFVVADVLPPQSGDLIIVPKEFTAQTGSDFDVDKLYMAFMSYTNGEFDSISDKLFEKIVDSDKPFLDPKDVFGDDFEDKELSDELKKKLDIRTYRNAIANRLLGNYIDTITDIKTFADARESIDKLTKQITNDLLPLVRETYEDYRSGGYELLPSFQSNTKREFLTGKDGISPFALHITNLAMTQFTNMCLDYGDNEFGFGKLDETLGKDNIRISAWLSAMVNAHVDVAKDPYVFAINVNKATYNHVCFLLRAGMGMSTFTLMSQPILKEYADTLNNSGGFYGPNIDGTSQKTSVYTGKKQKIYKDLLQKAKDEAKKAIDERIGISSKEEYLQLKSKYTALISSEDDSNVADWKEAFNEESAKRSLENPESAHAKYFQLLALMSFEKISRYAEELSRLVHLSQIDTKKFGNSIALHINFENSINNFKFGAHQAKWYINDEVYRENEKYLKTHGKNHPEYGKIIKEREKDTSFAARKYFGSLFLDYKFRNAKNFTKQILSRQTYTATKAFDEIFKSVMMELNGSTTLKAVEMHNGVRIEKPIIVYKEVKDTDYVEAVAQAVENIIRYRVLMHNGLSILKRIKKDVNPDAFNDVIDFTFGGDPEVAHKELDRLFNGLPDSEDPYSRRSIFKNLANLIQDIREDGFNEEFDGLTDPETGELQNDFLKFLMPQLKGTADDIGRMLLFKNQMSLDPDEKSVLIAGFDQMLRHLNERVRRIARDIAIYAYYSTYDVSTPNSFFDLVPSFYRQQYDLALKHGLMTSDDAIYAMISSDPNLGIDSEIIDVIARNYWYDDNIVPIYYNHRKSAINHNWTLLTTPFVKSSGKSKFNGAILTSYADSPFIKMKKGDDIMLYKRVGEVKREPKSKEIKAFGNKLYVYVAIPKLGYHNNGTHHYELSGDEHVPSIFLKQNRISNRIEYDVLKPQINKLIPSDSSKFKYTLEYDDGALPYIADEMYFVDKSRTAADYSNDARNLSFIADDAKGIIKKKKNSTVLIDINHDKNNRFENEISVNIEDSTQSIIDAIVEKIGDVETPVLYFSKSDASLTATDEEIQNYADRMCQEYRQGIIDSSTEGVSVPHLDEEVEQYRKDNWDNFVSGANVEKRDKKIFDILSGVITQGRGKFKIRGVYGEDVNGVGGSVGNAIMLTAGEFNRPNVGGALIIDHKYRLKKYDSDFEDIKDMFYEANSSFVPAEWQQQLISAIKKFVESVEDVTSYVLDLSDSISLDTNEVVEQVTLEIEKSEDTEDQATTDQSQDNNIQEKPSQPEEQPKKKKASKVKSKLEEESNVDDNPGVADADDEVAAIDMGAFFGRRKKQYHIQC